jgi:hypothetical protein
LYSKEDKDMMDSPDNYLKLIIKDEHSVDEDDDLYVKHEMTFKEALASWKRSRILNKEY